MLILNPTMASEKQIQANRRNAAQSTGPNTPEGKARSARNAVRHGLMSREAVLPEEDRKDYRNLLAELEAEYHPSGPTQEFLVREMASAQWRLRRLMRVETGYFRTRIAKARRWETNKDDRREENDHDEDTRLMGIAFDNSAGADPFGSLARYQNMLRRAFYKALAALEKMQNEPNLPAAPAAVTAPDTPSAPGPRLVKPAAAPPRECAGTSPAPPPPALRLECGTVSGYSPSFAGAKCPHGSLAPPRRLFSSQYGIHRVA
jgi:hypothetical protein